eukprot:CAMPEP_0172532150 /NCGR_PEP_ID=MMETSP1067-20121228/5303_1 /TAXON_ID=265564 ORGANISM="Thalassiosira punctigera, Strain Tpunct2005C2" /NCGR_SAMPLE_ID=MMETSP1067 /ASSEMBLY_ACC=CAM_ASM_000444 /LENGTH=452 /DNA_ID=CAMNT_0013316627 /DNA_START=81 /DNA_END=1439 /DNA_ORIENTATION=-
MSTADVTTPLLASTNTADAGALGGADSGDVEDVSLSVNDYTRGANDDVRLSDKGRSRDGKDEVVEDAKYYAEEDEDERSVIAMTSNFCSGWNWLHVLYLSLFSAVGVTLRAFSERFFGGDCESNAQGHPIDDWLWPLSHRICVTASGKTEQYGGALFLDLPANMIGSFIMGFMTGHSSDLPAIPWLSHDHPLQDALGLHVGIKTALCGSLTTFSSWNSQMVLMMDGTANPYLHSQVIAALFGYLIGLQAAVVCYRAGRTVAAWIHLRKNPHVFDSDLSKREGSLKWHYEYIHWITPVALCIVIATLIALYMLGDIYWGIAYYRILWIACFAAPIGTMIRWKLSSLNGKFRLPLGTFLANFIGSILSASLAAWATIESDHKGAQRWEIPIIKAVSLGIAGSLSTVSTFAKECVEMADKNPPYDKSQFIYSYGSMLICCLFGLLVYSPIVRYAN